MLVPDLTIPGTILAGCVGAAILWSTKKLVTIAEEMFRNWLKQKADQQRQLEIQNMETRALIDAHITDCMLRRQSEAGLVEQVANLDDKVCDMGVDIGKVEGKLDRLIEHLMK